MGLVPWGPPQGEGSHRTAGSLPSVLAQEVRAHVGLQTQRQGLAVTQSRDSGTLSRGCHCPPASSWGWGWGIFKV